MTLYRLVVQYEVESESALDLIKEYLTTETVGVNVNSDFIVADRDDAVDFTYEDAKVLNATIVNIVPRSQNVND